MSRRSDGERFASGTVQLARPLGLRNKLGIELSALYQNQVMDVSETETNLTRILVEGVGISLKPKWNHTFGPGWEMRLEAVGGPQLYAGEVDSYWEAGGKLTSSTDLWAQIRAFHQLPIPALALR